MKVQNKKGLGIVSKLFLLAAVLVLQVVILGQTTITANAQGTAKVTADSGKIRKTPDTSADVLGSVKENDKLTVIAQTTASDGYTWYKVFVDDTTKGYIRADLVGEVEGSIETESASDAAANDTADDDDDDDSDTSSENTNDNAQEEEEEEDEPQQQEVEFVQVNPSTVSKAKVTASSVNVRSNPSTNAPVAGKAKADTEVNVFGEATDGAGAIWYQVKYTSGDTTVEGFIRSDFVEVIEQVQEEVPQEPAEEEPVEEAPVEEPSVPKEYEVVYEANPEGVEEWFLYDHNRGTKQSIADLLAVVRQTQDDEKSAVGKLKTYKIFMIVMVAVILALIVGITLLIFKLNDAYDYEYDDDDEDEDDEDEDDEDDEDDEEEMYSRAPVRRKTVSQPARTAAPAPARGTRPAQREAAPAPQKKESSSWQSKNFLDIDDDMEFEFLDIK